MTEQESSSGYRPKAEPIPASASDAVPPSADADDANDIARFLRSNNPEDLHNLISRHMPTVHSVAWKMTGSASAADDITQDVFVKVFHGLKNFRNQSTFSTWLYRVALNTTYTWLSKIESVNKNEQCWDGMLVTERQSAQPPHRLVQQELASKIDQAINALKPDLRAAIVLTAIDNLSSTQAAEISQCTVEAFYSRLHLARKQLKQQLKRYLES